MILTGVAGVLLAILERSGVINNMYSEMGEIVVVEGTVAAGYQNFIICIEMLFAAIALHSAFPHNLYAQQETITKGRTVSLQSISSNLKETMNPKDIISDTIHNFHPQYQQYIQQGSNIPQDEVDFYRDHEIQPQANEYPHHEVQNDMHHAPAHTGHGHGHGHGHQVRSDYHNGIAIPPPLEGGPRPNIQTGKKHRFTEKTTLLSSDDEFQ